MRRAFYTGQRASARKARSRRRLLEFVAPNEAELLRAPHRPADAIRAAPTTRGWMDCIPDNHAYRSLPLRIAKSLGGRSYPHARCALRGPAASMRTTLTFASSDGFSQLSQYAVSHFAYGVVTFQLYCLFRAEPGWDLFASASLNSVKDGIAPLAGVIETDWLPYPFTMNWQMTRPGTVRFERDEPLCMVFPVPHGVLLSVEPEIFDLDDDLNSRRRRWRGRSAATVS
jgi:hypothetical protein